MKCRHPQRELGRVLFKGGACHVMERCLACKVNVRGAGRWVPRSELAVRAESLPVFIDRRTAEERGEQRLMF